MEPSTFRFPDPAGSGHNQAVDQTGIRTKRDTNLSNHNIQTTSPPPSENPSSPTSNGKPNGVISPVYWHHDRSSSHASHHSVSRGIGGGGGITLEDHTETPSETSSALWARTITIPDYTLVQGTTTITPTSTISAPTLLGAYIVYNVRVETLDGGPIFIRKRYSEFDQLRQDLVLAFPHATKHTAALPLLPPKSLFKKFQPRFLEARRKGLAYFLNCVLLNPEFAGSPIVKDFIFSRGDD
ncbi:putative px domain protein [Phaeomoniella chlamydospora]|uniref:Endosomal/vacuolar adapter protein YPT35 n=1 Tax=Phaeomoniella chlamydospora TaxID=158046 RepID=A0A0G2EH01_PHACM|nr:putative px domain protein [Phaeomoniella chlamydospora]